MARILRPGGVLRLRDLVYAFEPHESDEVVGAWLDSATAHPEGGYTRAELEAHVGSEHSTFSWLLERVGFTIEARAFSDDRMYAEYLCSV